MIISHRHRYVFLKTKKTAGSSVEIALSRSCGPDDVITQLPRPDEELRRQAGGLGRQNNSAPPLTVSLHEHSGARRCRRGVGRETFEGYYRFAIERNPWDAVVSLYYWVNRRTGSYSFEEFLERPEVANLAAQNHAIWHIDGRVAVDRVVRYESLEHDLTEVWQHLGLPGSPDLPRAKSGIRPGRVPYRDLYDAGGRQRVGELFAPMIDELGYSF
ncbi:sulfotransferase family 2 domain-containing protein [Nocardioides marinquilinus]|uniref:Sulfotransferase family 2 domain-containing protein n=1 Tax=Nocardioides marinquilinus TaxID=1210400 RepID=A0ABP9Q160_9ACTN